MPRRVIALDAGGTKVLWGVVDEELRVEHRAVHSWPEPRTREGVLAVISEALSAALEAAPDAEAVGIGIPCNVDVERGISISSRHLPLEDFAFSEWVTGEIGPERRVLVDNDSTMAMVAEHQWGAAHRAEHAVMLTIGTGIGGGVVVDGCVVRGRHGAAGEPGHMTLDPDGPPCPGNCPNRGCLEAYVSGPALAAMGEEYARSAPDYQLGRMSAERPLTGADVVQAARAGDPGAREALERMGEKLGAGIASLVNLLDPEVVVIGGGLGADAGPLLIEPAERAVRERALEPGASQVRIAAAELGADAGLLGAATVAMEAS